MGFPGSIPYKARAENSDDCVPQSPISHSKMYVGTLVAIIVAAGLLVFIPIAVACYLGRRRYVVAKFKVVFGSKGNDKAGVTRRSTIQDVEQGNTIQTENSAK